MSDSRAPAFPPPPPLPPATPPGSAPAPAPVDLPVVALYTPKSVHYTRDADGSFRVTIRSHSVFAYLFAMVAVPFVFLFMPLIGFIFGVQSALMFFLLIGALIVFLIVKSAPILHIAREGIRVNGLLYRAQDSTGFREGTDSAWLFLAYQKFGLSCVGLQYGIYTIRLPYTLPRLEVLKVVQFLNAILKSLQMEMGEERTRKIQQAETF